MSAITEAEFLDRVRAHCAALPGSAEIVSHGHPAFTNGKQIYAVIETVRGEPSLCVKVGLDLQGVFLSDSRFYLTPFIGKQGWVSLKIQAAPIDWEEVAALLEASHALCRVVKVKEKPRP